MILDFYDDSTGVVLKEILADVVKSAGVEAIPESIVKNASLIPSEEFRKEKSLFAYQDRFALDTPDDVWFSARYFEKTAHQIPFQHRYGVIENIKVAAELHGVDVSFLDAKEAAFTPVADDAFLVVHGYHEGDGALAKHASEMLTEAEDGVVKLRAYRIDTPENVKVASQWFPRGLTGELAQYRKKVASRLVELCEANGLDLPHTLVEEVRPIKRSHLIDHIQTRIGAIVAHNNQAARNNGLLKAAADRGLDLPYAVEAMTPVDTRIITAYQELAKMAHEDEIPKKFWGLFEKLDKAANIEAIATVTPVEGLNREVEDDFVVTTCKLAGTVVYLPQVMEKISSDMWQDLAPQVLEAHYNLTKIAGILGELDEMTQHILLTRVRGY